jgi:hypothetical protein
MYRLATDGTRAVPAVVSAISQAILHLHAQKSRVRARGPPHTGMEPHLHLSGIGQAGRVLELVVLEVDGLGMRLLLARLVLPLHPLQQLRLRAHKTKTLSAHPQKDSRDMHSSRRPPSTFPHPEKQEDHHDLQCWVQGSFGSRTTFPQTHPIEGLHALSVPQRHGVGIMRVCAHQADVPPPWVHHTGLEAPHLRCAQQRQQFITDHFVDDAP